jgi:hypothetical protein
MANEEESNAAAEIHNIFQHLHTAAATNAADIDTVRAQLEVMDPVQFESLCVRIGAETRDKQGVAQIVAIMKQGAQILGQFGLFSGV